jgi:DNA-directed RNA polymerase specialized sigma24 family protein
MTAIAERPPTTERRGRASIDFHAVEPHQRAMDRRLANWARWCNGTSAPMTSPMFRMTPPPPRVRADMAYQISDVLDTADATKMAKAVAALPQSNRTAINWHYVKPVSPKRACQALGTTMEGLAKLVRDGRQMLINQLE